VEEAGKEVTGGAARTVAGGGIQWGDLGEGALYPVEAAALPPDPRQVEPRPVGGLPRGTPVHEALQGLGRRRLHVVSQVKAAEEELHLLPIRIEAAAVEAHQEAGEGEEWVALVDVEEDLVVVECAYPGCQYGSRRRLHGHGAGKEHTAH